MVSHCSWKKTVKILFVFILFINSYLLAKDLQPEVKFEKISVEISNTKIEVDLASTSEQHQKGMMYREKLDSNEGMLFIFETEQVLSFWMKNTLVDLSIAYIDKNKKIIDIQEMKATSLLATTNPISYPSKKPALYALEMPKGWFKKNKIKVGNKIKFEKK